MFIMDVHRTSSVMLLANVAVDAVRFPDQLERRVPLEQPVLRARRVPLEQPALRAQQVPLEQQEPRARQVPLERQVPPERRVPLERRAPLEQPEAVLAPALLQENC